ncbi:CynX/NimT family MFS transporter [Yinghuangia seranimata]|uniref:CynX/NimT family MFS transporter n=1 Tax=Yinghuangia seranimata TaxID=408067 RepID=UPI00248BA5A0|nr:MFS transporter [Yinghuangia seranimata]MDI2131915.1 MFS transporter [Yinghuangia seranimata]
MSTSPDRISGAPCVPPPRGSAAPDTPPRTPGASVRRGAGGALLVAGVVLISLNMRAALSGVSPLVGELRTAFGLSTTVGGLITAIPVLFLGLVSPVAPALARRIGAELTLLAALVVLTCGIVVRTVPSLVALFAGGVLVGGGIAVLNVLMPAVVKRDFPDRTAVMMGAYSSTMVCGAAVAAGASVPIENAIGHGWRPALGVWAALSVLAIAVWLPQVLRARRARETQAAQAAVAGVWRSPLAWQVTGFMGLQSLLFYVVLAWLPTMLTDDGMTKGDAAAVFAFSTVCQIPASLGTSLLAGRLRDQRLPVVAAMALTAGGYVGLLFAPAAGAWVWAALLGLGQGAAVALALTLIVLRSPDPQVAAQLSGMAQAVGYVLAAFGPLAAGAFKDASGGWSVPILVMLALAGVATASGLGAARPLHVRVSRRIA